MFKRTPNGPGLRPVGRVLAGFGGRLLLRQRWASNRVAGSENTGLYFDKFDPNVACVNIQHPNSGVDRLVQITAVPEPESYATMLAGLVGLGFIARRRKG